MEADVSLDAPAEPTIYGTRKDKIDLMTYFEQLFQMGEGSSTCFLLIPSMCREKLFIKK